MAQSTNRTGRVSAIDYKAGTYEVTYVDRDRSVTRKINAMSNGEYKMPRIGDIVTVNHNSNGTAAGTATGTIWNQNNRPVEGYEGLYRKEYSNNPGQAYSRYDEKTGVFTQYVDGRTGRNCNGEIYDEAGGSASVVAGGQIMAKSRKGSIDLSAAKNVEITAGQAVNVESETGISISTKGNMSTEVTGNQTVDVTGTNEENYLSDVTQNITGNVTQTITGDVDAIITGNVTLSVNGAIIQISSGGDVTISSPTQINIEAPIINVTGASGDVKIQSISLVTHTHKCKAPEEESEKPTA